MLLRLANALTQGVFRLSPETPWGGAVSFFIYDSVKILFLLFVFIGVVGVLRSYVSQAKVRAWMGKTGWAAHGAAAVFGAVTPFCSCSSIPFFIGFLEAGIPLGVGFSFLITSPVINEYLVVLMVGYFGWKIAALYVLSGLLVGTGAGFLLGRLRLEKHLVSDLVAPDQAAEDRIFTGFADRLRFGFKESVSILKKIWVWVLVGVAVGSVIHNVVPQGLIENAIKKTGVLSVPIATLLGVPLYGSCAAIVPIAVALFQKGIPLGTALAFMMAVSALSLPEAVMLRRAMKLPLIGIFFGVTTLAIILTGYLFNAVQALLT